MFFHRIRSFAFRPINMVLSALVPMSEIERIVYRKLSRQPEFTFNGQRIPYFFHSYNDFGITERMIEIPVIKYFMEQGSYANVLEIGNVTNHYYDLFRQVFTNKTTVDKFEKGYNVVNRDIHDYAPAEKFDFVFSISTFEHMDSDLGRNPQYVKGNSRLVSVAADNIKHVGDTMVKDKGKFVVTAPLCYTPEWKETFYSGDFAKCGFRQCRTYLFKRSSELTWRQVPEEDGRNAEFDSYFPYRNYLSIVEFDK